MLLRLEGHEVHIANDGPSALELAEKFEPNIAVLDIGLPGLNGYELARRLRSRQNDRGLLLIAVTGYGQPEDRPRSQAAGFDRHMVKPLDPHTLGAEIADSGRLPPQCCSGPSTDAAQCHATDQARRRTAAYCP